MKLIKLFMLGVAVTAALTIAGSAVAGSTPTYRVDYSDCEPWTTGSSMRANYHITAADLTPYRGEMQLVYVRTALYSHTLGRYIGTSPWVEGYAYDFDEPWNWYLASNGAYLGGVNYRLTFTGIPRGTYQLAVQFAWEQSTAGAPAGQSAWVYAPDTCTFTA